MSIQNQVSGHERISCVYREGYRVVRSPCNQFRRENIKTVHYGLQSVKYLGPNIWQLVPNNIQYGISLSKFKKLIKPWQPEACPAGCVRHLLLKYSFFNYLIINKYFTSHVKVATYNFLRRFFSNILFKILIPFLNCYCCYKFWSDGVI